VKKFIDWSDFTQEGIFRESTFREQVESIDWSEYKEKTILIKGCSQVEVPVWAYCVVTAKLVEAGAQVTFGEFQNPIPVTKGK